MKSNVCYKIRKSLGGLNVELMRQSSELIDTKTYVKIDNAVTGELSRLVVDQMSNMVNFKTMGGIINYEHR